MWNCLGRFGNLWYCFVLVSTLKLIDAWQSIDLLAQASNPSSINNQTNRVLVLQVDGKMNWIWKRIPFSFTLQKKCDKLASKRKNFLVFDFLRAYWILCWFFMLASLKQKLSSNSNKSETIGTWKWRLRSGRLVECVATWQMKIDGSMLHRMTMFPRYKAPVCQTNRKVCSLSLLQRVSCSSPSLGSLTTPNWLTIKAMFGFINQSFAILRSERAKSIFTLCFSRPFQHRQSTLVQCGLLWCP